MVWTEGTILLAGLVLLWWAGDRAVRYAIEITEFFGISSFTIGFLVMSVSTGLPEIVTAIVSAFSDAAGLSAGNVLGASLANVTMVLGASAIAAKTLSIDRDDEAVLLQIMGIITLLTVAIFFTSGLTTVHGIILLAAYGISILFLRRRDLMQKIVEEEVEEAEEDISEEVVLADTYGTLIKFFGSLALVVLGAHLAVDSATTLASSIGIPMETIGATLIAIGTALPELTLELNAVKRREYALALGDIFGSSLVNLSLVLGLLSVLSPGSIDIVPLVGTIVYLGAALGFVWYAMMWNHGLERWHGIVLLVLFAMYLIEEIGIVTVIYQVL